MDVAPDGLASWEMPSARKQDCLQRLCELRIL